MLKIGVLEMPIGIYDFYEVDESGYYRFDLMQHGAAFDRDVDKLIYSILTRKNTSVYGDPTIYDMYNNIMMQIESIHKQTEKTSSWEDGKFITVMHSFNEKLKCDITTKMENAIPMVKDIKFQEYHFVITVARKVYGVRTLPINFDEYTKVTLSKDTIKEASSVPYYTLDTLKRKLDIGHLDNNDFCVATDESTANRRLQEWTASPNPYKGFDTETTGLDVNLYGEDHLVGIILGETPTKSTYFPFRHIWESGNLSTEFLQTLMKHVLEQQDRLVAHNKKFDRKVMLKEGFDLHIKWDTLWGSMILNPVFKQGVHGEKNLIYELDGLRYLELEDIFISKKDINFSVLTPDLVKAYACPDGTNVIKLLEHQLRTVPQNQMRLWDLENRMADICADMEYYGIRVDVEKYKKQYENCNYIIDTLLTAFRTLTHEDGNLNSNEVLVNLIYNKMKCPILKRTETGQPSVGAAIIKMLGAKKAKEPKHIEHDITDMYGKPIITAKALSESAYPAMLILAKYKEYNKLKTAFYARFERTMSTGRVFFWINQWGAATGRQSSPMHQLPPDLKDCILSDSEDKDFWGPDFSQIELRMIAYLAGEQDLIDLACDAEKDVHRIIGSLINKCEMWEITKEMRTTGKRRNFGVVYLISAMGLAAQMFGPAYTKENLKFCQQQLDDFYNSFKRIDRYIRHNAILVQQRGYMETKWFHRKRLFNEIFDPNLEPRKRASILRMSNNVPVQGTAADYLKLAEVQMYDWIYARGWNKPGKDGFPLVRMMLSIHDELIISADRSIPYEEIITMITKCMETPVEGAPPFFTQPALMDNWGGHSDDACAMPIPLRDKLIEDYLHTGKSVINHDNYLQVLADFRKDKLTNYMHGLISKYGPDYKNVGKHVRDGVLTFELLDLYEKGIRKKNPDITQEDLITEATKLYMEDLGSEKIPELVSKPAPVESEIIQNHISDDVLNELEVLVDFDKDGNPIYTEQDYEDVLDVLYDDEVEEVDTRVNQDPQYVWKLFDKVVVDTIDIPTNDEINFLLAHMMQYQKDGGFYSSAIIYNNKYIDTGIQMEHPDLKELNEYVINLVKNRNALVKFA